MSCRHHPSCYIIYRLDYVLKALSSLSTPEEKLAALCKKYTDLLDENRQHSSLTKSSSKKLSQVSRERDSLQTENSKLILAKSKLESLCRELQRHNKVVKVSYLNEGRRKTLLISAGECYLVVA